MGHYSTEDMASCRNILLNSNKVANPVNKFEQVSLSNECARKDVTF